MLLQTETMLLVTRVRCRFGEDAPDPDTILGGPNSVQMARHPVGIGKR